MSIKITASFTDEAEKELILRITKPILRAGYKFKIVKGEPYSHIYIQPKSILNIK